jgi:hypothetical protein
MLPTDFRIGLDVGILGRSIRINDVDQYTREFFEVRYSTITTTFSSPNKNGGLFYITYYIDSRATSGRALIGACRQFC